MSELQVETAFLSTVIPYDDSDESLKLHKSMAQLQHDQRCVRRLSWAMALVLMLGLAGVGYGGVLQEKHENLPYNLSQHVINVSSGFVVASLVCLMAFAGLLVVYRRKLKWLRNECLQLAARLLESRLGKPQIPSVAGSHRGVIHSESPPGAAVSGALLADSSAICGPELKAQ
jgi:hypothetical protein